MTAIDLGRLKDADFSEIAAELADAALCRLSPAMSTVARSCIVSHWFDAELVGAVAKQVGVDAEDEVFPRLVALPFVERLAADRYAFHDATRQAVLARMAEREPELLRRAGRLAGDVLAESEKIAARAESMYCLLVGGEHRRALALQDELLERCAHHGDWQLYGAVTKLQREAERLPSVAPAFEIDVLVLGADDGVSELLQSRGLDADERPITTRADVADWLRNARKTVVVLTPGLLSVQRDVIQFAVDALPGPEARARRIVPVVIAPGAEGGLTNMDSPPILTYEDDNATPLWTEQLLVALGHPSPSVTDTPLPANAAWHFPHGPDFTGGFVGRHAELDRLERWLADQDRPTQPVLVMSGLGGAGKTSLTYEWLRTSDAVRSMSAVLWWSFYEEPNFDRFVAYTLERLGPADRSPARADGETLIHALRGSRALLILDGFERVSEGSPGVGPFLSAAATGATGASRLLVTTRRLPEALEDGEGGPKDNTAWLRIGGLAKRDAVGLLRRAGVRGDPTDLDTVASEFDRHALSLRVLAGLIRSDPHRAGDVEVVRRIDVQGSLVQRRSHIVAFAYDELDPDARKRFSALSCVGGVASFDDAVAVLDADPASVVADLKTFHECGLLEFDSTEKRFEIHPAVRSFAATRLSERDRAAVHLRLASLYRDRVAAHPEDPLARERLEDHALAAAADDILIDLMRKRIADDVRAAGIDDARATAVIGACAAVLEELIGRHGSVGRAMALSAAVHHELLAAIVDLMSGRPVAATHVAVAWGESEELTGLADRDLEALAAELVELSLAAIEHNAALRGTVAPEEERVSRDIADEIKRAIVLERATDGTRRDYLRWAAMAFRDANPEHGIARFDVPLTWLTPTEDGATVAPRDLPDALEQQLRILLVGGPGSGKTVALRRAAAALVAAQLSLKRLTAIPIYVDLRSYHAGRELTADLARHLRAAGCDVSGIEDMLAQGLQSGETVLLLDGLDELRHGDRAAVMTWIASLDGRQRVVLAGRLATELWTAADFAVLRIGPLDASAARDFVISALDAHFTHGEPDSGRRDIEHRVRRHADELLASFKTRAGLRSLADSPATLMMLVRSYLFLGRLPRGRIALYSQFAETLDQPTRVTIEASGVSRDRLFAAIAYALQSSGSPSIDEKRLLEIVREALEQQWPGPSLDPGMTRDRATSFLADIRGQDGILVELAARQYAFRARPLQEYFAAQHLVRNLRDTPNRIREHLHDPSWDETLALALGYIGDRFPEHASDVLLAAVLARGPEAHRRGFSPSPHEDVLARDRLFAMRCIVEDVPAWPDLQIELGSWSASELLTQRGPGRFAGYRDTVLEVLWAAESGALMDAAVHVLLDGLHSEEPPVRARAARYLDTPFGPPATALPALTEALRDTAVRVRFEAARTLLGAGIDSAVEPWLALIRSDDPALRRAAVSATQDFASLPPILVAPLRDLLADDDEYVRAASLVALAQAEHTQAISLDDVITAARDGEPSSTLFRAATLALRRLSEHGQPVDDFIVARAAAGHGSERRFAIRALPQLSVSRAGNEILHSYLDDPETSHDALLALTEIGDTSPAMLRALQRLATSRVGSMRRDAAACATKLAFEAGSPAKTAPRVRDGAEAELRDLLAQRLDDDDPGVRLIAAQGLLGQREFPRALAVVEHIAASAEGRLRLAAVTALSSYRPDASLGAAVAELLASADPKVRAAALHLVPRVRDGLDSLQATAFALLAADPEPGVRTAAVSVLAQFPAARPALRQRVERALRATLDEAPRAPDSAEADVGDVAWSALRSLMSRHAGA